MTEQSNNNSTNGDGSVFQYAFRASPVPMIITRLSDGLILDANPAFSRWSGYDVEGLFCKEAMDPKFWDNDDDRVRLRSALFKDGVATDFPCRLKTATGDLRYCSVSAQTFKYQKDPSTVTIVRDLTEQHEREQQQESLAKRQEILIDLEALLLQQQEPEQILKQGLRFIFEQMGVDRVWLVDPSESTLKIADELTRPDYPGALSRDIPLPLRTDLTALLEKVRSDQKIVCFGPDQEYPLTEMAERMFQVKGQMVAILKPQAGKSWLLGLHQCSHARSWTEEEQSLFSRMGSRLVHYLNTVTLTRDLRQSESRYRDLFDSAPEAITIVDSRTGGFVEFNNSMLSMLQYSAEELSQLKIIDASAPKQNGMDASIKIQEKINQLQEGKSPEFEWLYLDAKGNEVPAEVRLSKIPGTEYLFRATATNLSQRRTLERQLYQAQKMESVGQLAGGIAHDFNNLLQGILGFSALLLQECHLSTEQNKKLQHIHDAAERAATLTKQLLAFGRRQVLDKKDINLNELFTSDKIEVLQRILGSHIEIDLIPTKDLGTVHVDPGQIEQVMLNLCLNARDAMPDGGKITIETENVLITGEYCRTHPWAAPGRFILISVSDNGLGMDEETLANIFEPFFTTKKDKGSGLGLAMVHGIVNQHKGMVQAYSELNRGTTVKIYLPIVERPATAIGSKIPEPVTGGYETILLAEDDERILELAQTVLEEAGYKVLIAKDGAEALRQFKTHPDNIDLIILDVIMPNIGGKETYELIHALDPQVPCLFSSGYSINAIHTGFVLQQGLELIQKPYTPSALLQKIRGMLDRK